MNKSGDVKWIIVNDESDDSQLKVAAVYHRYFCNFYITKELLEDRETCDEFIQSFVKRGANRHLSNLDNL